MLALRAWFLMANTKLNSGLRFVLEQDTPPTRQVSSRQETEQSSVLTSDDALVALSVVAQRGDEFCVDKYETDDGDVWVEAYGPRRRIVLRYSGKRGPNTFSWAVVTKTHTSYGTEENFSISNALSTFLDSSGEDRDQRR